ncbi:MAG: phosphatidate cytidylyltransferase [candidate division WOR-3 bacterium]
MKSSSVLNRIIIGTLLGLVIAITTFGPPFLLLIFIAVWLTVATVELLNILRLKAIQLNPYITVGSNLFLFLAVLLKIPKGFYLLPIFLIILAGLLAKMNRSSIITYGIFTYFYLGFLPAHFLMLKQLSITVNFSTWLVLFPLFLTWINDTGGLLGGKLFGKTKLAPDISPNKTIEGFASGVFLAAIFAYLYLKHFMANQPFIQLFLLGLIMGSLAQVGDLVESVFKREAGLKDSSNLLFAHGGFLDRIDSLLFTIPVFYYYLKHIINS